MNKQVVYVVEHRIYDNTVGRGNDDSVVAVITSTLEKAIEFIKKHTNNPKTWGGASKKTPDYWWWWYVSGEIVDHEVGEPHDDTSLTFDWDGNQIECAPYYLMN